MDPYYIVVLDVGRKNVGKALIDLLIGFAEALVKGYFVWVIMKKRPKDGVCCRSVSCAALQQRNVPTRKAVVVLVREIFFQENRNGIVVLAKGRADILHNLFRNDNSWPAEPLEFHLLGQCTKPRIEAPRRYLVFMVSLPGALNGDR